MDQSELFKQQLARVEELSDRKEKHQWIERDREALRAVLLDRQCLLVELEQLRALEFYKTRRRAS